MLTNAPHGWFHTRPATVQAALVCAIAQQDRAKFQHSRDQIASIVKTISPHARPRGRSRVPSGPRILGHDDRWMSKPRALNPQKTNNPPKPPDPINAIPQRPESPTRSPPRQDAEPPSGPRILGHDDRWMSKPRQPPNQSSNGSEKITPMSFFQRTSSSRRATGVFCAAGRLAWLVWLTPWQPSQARTSPGCRLSQ